MLLTKARCLEKQGILDHALDCYEEALSKASSNSVPVSHQIVVGSTTGNVVKGLIGNNQ